MQSVSAISAHAFTKHRMGHCNESETKARFFHWNGVLDTPMSIEKPTVMTTNTLVYNGTKNNNDRIDDNDCDCNCDYSTCTTGTSRKSSSSVVTVIEDYSSDSPVSQYSSGNKNKNKNINKNKNKRTNKSKTKTNKKTNGVYRRDHRRVRFSPGTNPEPTTRRKIKKRKPSEQSSSSSSGERSPQGALEDSDSTCNSVRWWSKEELKSIQNSCAFAVKTRDFMSSLSLASQPTTANAAITAATQRAVYGDSMLDRFSEPNRKRRKLVRWQMYETTKVVQQYETATETKAPPELLSELLRNYSKPMEMEAIESALRIRWGSDLSHSIL